MGGVEVKRKAIFSHLCCPRRRDNQGNRESGGKKKNKKLLSSLPEGDRMMTHVPRNDLRAKLRQRLYSRSWFAVQRSHHKSNNKYM